MITAKGDAMINVGPKQLRVWAKGSKGPQ